MDLYREAALRPRVRVLRLRLRLALVAGVLDQTVQVLRPHIVGVKALLEVLQSVGR